MKKLFVFLMTGAAFMLCGAIITPDFNGEFKERGKYWGFLGVKRGTLASAADGALVITRFKDQPYADVGNTKNTFEIRKGDKVTMTVRAKGKGTLAGTAQPGDDHQFVIRDGQIDIFNDLLAGG